MTFDEILDQVLALLQRRGRLTSGPPATVGSDEAYLGTSGEYSRTTPRCRFGWSSPDLDLSLAEELSMRPLQAHCHRVWAASTRRRDIPSRPASSCLLRWRSTGLMDMIFWLPETTAMLAQVEGDRDWA